MPRRPSLPAPGHDPQRHCLVHGRPAGSGDGTVEEWPLEAGAVHPQVRIAHRLIGNVAVRYREIVDHEFIAVLEGEGDFHCGHRRHRYGPRSLIFIPPGTPHTLITRCGPHGDHLAVHFDWAPGVPQETRRLDPYRVRIAGLPLPPPVQPLDDVAIGLLADAVRHHRAEDPLGDLRASLAMQQLILHLAERGDPGSEGRGDPAVAAALDTIEEHYAEDLGVEDLALVAGLARSRFAQRFKAWSGRPPMAFLRRYRIDRAADLLIHESGLSLAAIAGRCGFADAFSLSKAFKAELGLSPDAFRRARNAAG